MAITFKEASLLAHQYGLTLTDAKSLISAATFEEAQSIAKIWSEPRQRSRAELKTMTPTEILAARDRGELSELLGQKKPTKAPAESGQLTREDLASMSPEQVLEARDRGDLNHLLKGGN